MHTFSRYFLPAIFVILFGSCTIQDHLVPEESSPCRVSLKLNELDTYLIPPGETVTIGQEVYGLQGNFKVHEILELKGASYAIGWKSDILRIGAEQSNTSYEYDSEGRVKKTINRIKRPTADLTEEFDYFPTEIKVKVTEDYHNRPIPPTYDKTYTLNSQGLVTKFDPPNSYIGTLPTYDADGYVIARGEEKLTIENGNTVKSEAGTDQNYRYEYDLTKPNPLPNPLPFFGKIDRNLRTAMFFIEPSTYKVDYDLKYIYDKGGRLKYEILLITYPDDPRIRLRINGYEWTCPQ